MRLYHYYAPKRTFKLVIMLNRSQIHFTPDFGGGGRVKGVKVKGRSGIEELRLRDRGVKG